MDEKWQRLEDIVRRVIREELDARKPAKKYEPTIRLEGRVWVGISETQMEAWQAAYPAVDIEMELKKAAAWCVSNPSDAPKSQFGRFLNGWFGRNQNSHAQSAAKQRGIANVASRECSVCGKPPNLRVDNGDWRCLAHRYTETPMLRMVK